jgi:hypothetical protein
VCGNAFEVKPVSIFKPRILVLTCLKWTNCVEQSRLTVETNSSVKKIRRFMKLEFSLQHDCNCSIGFKMLLLGVGIKHLIERTELVSG